MNQLAIEFTPLARRTDPQTSIEAARRMEKSGKSAFQRRLILDCLKCHGPHSAKDIGSTVGLSNIEVSRRSGELVGEGKPCKYLHNERSEGCLLWALNSQCVLVDGHGYYVRKGAIA